MEGTHTATQMTRKREAVTISLTPEHKAILEGIAFRHGCLWGDNPNISELMRSIADGSLAVVASSATKPENASDPYTKALEKIERIAKSVLAKR